MCITLSGRRQALTDKLFKKMLENKDSKLRMFTSPTKYQMLQPQEVALTKPLMPTWIFMLEVSGRDRDLHCSTFGCVTPMQTLTEI